MTLRVRLVGFPDIQNRLGGDRIQVSLVGETLGDLATWLQLTHGDPTGTRLAWGGRVDPEVQVLRNGRWIPGDVPGQPLADGDEVAFLVLVAGG